MFTDAIDQTLNSASGTYVLHIELPSPTEIQVGRLGHLGFESPYYLYFGSAFGPGGLKARLRHHLGVARRPHWHIDYLRQKADVIGVWYSDHDARLECVWADVASTHRGVSPVSRFGSSDCSCRSHLLAARRLPSLRTFERRLREAGHACSGIREIRLARTGRKIG